MPQSHEGSAEINQIVALIIEKATKIQAVNNSDAIEEQYVKRMLITHFYELGTLSNKTAIAVAVSLVKDGGVSKRNAADRLHIHPHTLERWISRFEEHYEAEHLDPLDPQTLNHIDS